MKTESRDRKQKEAAAAFVVAEECGNVEALCQTFLKWGQVTFSQRGKATTTTKKSGGEGEKKALRLPFLSGEADRPGGAGGARAQLPAGVGRPRRFLRRGAGGRTPAAGGGRPREGRAGRPAAAPPPPVWPSTWRRPPGHARGALYSAFKESSERSECERLCPRRGPLRPHAVGVAPFVVSLIPGRRRAGPRWRGR